MTTVISKVCIILKTASSVVLPIHTPRLKNQKQKLTLDKAMKIIAANMEEFDKKNPVLSYHGFCSIMTSSLNDGFAEKKQRLHQDMGLPLSFYYMASSHNTYLEVINI